MEHFPSSSSSACHVFRKRETLNFNLRIVCIGRYNSFRMLLFCRRQVGREDIVQVVRVGRDRRARRHLRKEGLEGFQALQLPQRS